VVSAAPSSGKTLLLEVLATVCRNGWHTINPSVAVLYRKIDRQQPTVLLDEIDNYPLDERRDALAVLNAGYKPGATIDRCTDSGELQSFSAFCAKAYAGIDRRQLVDTLLSRSITIRLARRLATEEREMWITHLVEPDANRLRDRCEAWANGHIAELSVMTPALPNGMVNRAVEVWWVLLNIADLVGGDWPDRARSAWRVLSTGGDETDEVPDQLRLLADIRDAFGDERTISTDNLLAHLNELDESPWGARRRGEGLDARGLARMLRPFKVRPKKVRAADGVLQGYHLDSFEETFARHLPEAEQAEQAEHPALGPERNVPDVLDVPDSQTRAHDRDTLGEAWKRVEREQGADR
jgi:Protein of unknown function (DUF3631)